MTMLFKTSLLPYQQQAVKQLAQYRVGALYMEQGLGKTRTALDIIFRKLEAGKVEHVLWLCPCSIKKEIRAQFFEHIGFAPENITIAGIESISQSDRLYLQLHDLMSKKQCYLVVDESNLIKNFFALRSRRIIALGKLCRYRIVLNGTPISRNEADLFAQWYFLDWRILGYQSYWAFEQNHVEYYDNSKRIKNIDNLSYIVERIKPYAFQATKAECLKLPAKRYEISYCYLTEDQHMHYEYIRDAFLEYVDQEKPETIYRLFNALQCVISGFRILTPPSKATKKAPFFDDPADNPRFKKLLKTIAWAEDGEKIIVFCRYTREIKEVAAALNATYGAGAAVEFYGETPLKVRYEQIDKFRGQARFLIANKRCAAYGLNLQFCRHIIYYSNDWDLATRLQSEDRVYRIGQAREVLIEDICMAETIDERILDCLLRKERLAEEFKAHVGRRDKRAMAAWLDGIRDD